MKDRKDENEITKKIFDLILLYVLLHHGASVGTQDHTTKDTPLLVAVKNRQIEIVRLLLEKGAKPEYFLFLVFFFYWL